MDNSERHHVFFGAAAAICAAAIFIGFAWLLATEVDWSYLVNGFRTLHGGVQMIAIGAILFFVALFTGIATDPERR